MSASEKPTRTEVENALKAAGISLPAAETSELMNGKSVSLEGRPLGEIGHLLIRADALLAADNRGHSFTEFIKLPHADSSGCKGIKVVKVSRNCALYVQFPAIISICCTF